MATLLRSNEPPAKEPTLPAWLVSLGFHVTLIVLFMLFFRTVPRGAVEDIGRPAGIVLKHTTNDGEWFEGEDNQGTDATVDHGEDTPDMLDALPTEDVSAAAANMLPNPPTIGPGALESGGVGSAGEMTTGGHGRPGGLSGGKATVRVFGAEGVGNKFVYVFDRSVSMEGARLAAAKRELIQSLESLESTHQFQIIFFNHQVRVWDLTGGQRRIAFGTDSNKRLAARWVGGITADGGTDRIEALYRAIGLQPDVIFFLTDDDTPMTSTDLKQLKRRNRGRTVINAIEFGKGPPHGRRNFLVQLAALSGGNYAYVNTRKLGR